MTSKANVSWLKRLTTRVASIESGPEVITATTGLDNEVTVAQAKAGVIVTNTGASGAVGFQLPAAVPGMRVTAVVKAVQELNLIPASGESIAATTTNVQGTADYALIADAAGEYVELVCVVEGDWDVHGYLGTWTLTDIS